MRSEDCPKLVSVTSVSTPRLKTRIFDLYNGSYTNLSELARVMGIATSQIYRVRRGERLINQKFIIGAIKAFPGHKLDDLFYVAPGGHNAKQE